MPGRDLRRGPGPVRRIPLGGLARLQRAFVPEQATPARGRGPAAGLPGLVEPLTPRELEVLGSWD